AHAAPGGPLASDGGQRCWRTVDPPRRQASAARKPKVLQAMTEISPATHLASLIVFVLLVATAAPRIRRWWRRGCDRCRIEDMGGTRWSPVAHTCFPWRNPYMSRKGQLWL